MSAGDFFCVDQVVKGVGCVRAALVAGYRILYRSGQTTHVLPPRLSHWIYWNVALQANRKV
jgi:hypothetical protein